VIIRKDGPPFHVIGENIHASRVVKRDGARMGELPDGRPAVRVPVDGGEALLPVPDAIIETNDFRQGRVKHVMVAMRHGLEATEHAELGATYVRWIAARQVAGGADWLDVNVDEISHEVAPRLDAMAWTVRAVGPTAGVPLSLDSSDPSVISAGLDALDRSWADGARPLLNSASLERLDVLDLGRDHGLPLVLSCSGDVAMPTNAEERVDRANDIIAAALERGYALADLHVDPLVVPIGVDPEAGPSFFEAARRIREAYGPELHLTGGLSNSSFGLPARRLLGDVFLDVAALAGLDSGIVDPVATDLRAALSPDRDAEAYRMAADFIEGRDVFGMEFIEAFRAGRFG
jgi:5-methyltetrahydrofolate--homocysteine methyltransferase